MEVARETTPTAAAEPDHHEALYGWAVLAELVDDAAATVDSTLYTHRDLSEGSEGRKTLQLVARALRLAADDARRAMGLPEAKASSA